MYKKLLVLSIIIVYLAGCDDKVTEGMLIGDWRCTNTVNKQGQYDENRVSGPLADIPLLNPKKISYWSYNSFLISYDYDSKPRSINLLDRVYGKWETLSTGKGIIKKNYIQYIYIADDKFKIVTTDIHFRQSKEKFKIYRELICEKEPNTDSED